jgi:competence protein ComEC
MLLIVVAVFPVGSPNIAAKYLRTGLCVITAALGIAVALSAAPGTRNISRLFCWTLAGCAFGLLVAYQRGSDEFIPGLPAEKVRWVEGYVIADATPLQGGRSVIRIEVESCGDEAQSASARGRLTLFFTDDPALFCGNLFKCEVVSLHRGDNGDWSSTARGSLQIYGWRRGMDGVRAKILNSLQQLVYAGAGGEAEFLTALLLGIKEDPADPLVEKFRRAGVSHVLALSGMHLGIVAGFVLLIARRFLGTAKAYLLTIPILFFYIWVVGIRPSMLRAGIMYLLMWVRAVGIRRPDSLSVLAVSLICVSVIDPSSVSSLSFQLSFLALLGIMTLGPVCAGSVSSHLPKAVGLPLSMSVGAQIATAPVVAARFGMLYPIGIITSIVITPLIVVYLWAGIFFVLASLLYRLTGPLQIIMILNECTWFIMDQVRRLIVAAVLFFARVPGISVGNHVTWVSTICFIGFLVWRRYLEFRIKGHRFRLSAGIEDVAECGRPHS